MKGVTCKTIKGTDYWYARVDGRRVYCGKGKKGQDRAEKAIDAIERGILENPNLEKYSGQGALGMAEDATGLSPWEGRQEHQSAMNIIKSYAFQSVYQELKGGGQITEIEGKKAEQALIESTRTNNSAAARRYYAKLAIYHIRKGQNMLARMRTEKGIKTKIPYPNNVEPEKAHEQPTRIHPSLNLLEARQSAQQAPPAATPPAEAQGAPAPPQGAPGASPQAAPAEGWEDPSMLGYAGDMLASAATGAVRGVATGIPGMAGDIESLGRHIGETYMGYEGAKAGQVLPTSTDVENAYEDTADDIMQGLGYGEDQGFATALDSHRAL